MGSYLKTLFLSLLIFLIHSCEEAPLESDITTQAQEDLTESLELAISGLAGLSDDLSNENLSYQSPNSLPQKKKNFFDHFSLFEKCYAGPSSGRKKSCGARAIEAECNSGKQSKKFESCLTIGTDQVFEGEVTLEYKNSDNCHLENGESVTRSFDFTRRTEFGASVRTFSSERQDYRGEKYGGGTSLTKKEHGFEMDIHGKHRTRTSSTTKPRVDISMRTLSPLIIEGDLSRGNRNISEGEIEVSNNLSKYTIKMSPRDLGYTSDCCYPTSGMMILSIEGTLKGEGEVSFHSCGEGLLHKDGEQKVIEFDSCE